MGVRNPPAIPSIATTIAFNRTERRNATAVINVINKNVGIRPKNAK